MPKKSLLILITVLVLMSQAGAEPDKPSEMSPIQRLTAAVSDQQLSQLSQTYSGKRYKFREVYTLTADISANLVLFDLKLGSLNLGTFCIVENDTVAIRYDPPFEKWDTEYLTYQPDDSTYIEEVIGEQQEKFIYKKERDVWQLKSYQASRPREYKQTILEKGLITAAPSLVETGSLIACGQMTSIDTVLFLGELYPIRLSRDTTCFSRRDIATYELQWDVRSGEEPVQLHQILIAGLQLNHRFLLLTGILKVSFVGFIDLNVLGIIR